MPTAARLGLLLAFLFLLVAAFVAAGEWIGFFEEVERDERPAEELRVRVEGEVPPHLRGTAQEPGRRAIQIDLDHVDRDLDLHGRVVDDRGLPIPGTTLAVVTYPARGLPAVAVGVEASQAVFGPLAQSAPDGRFALRLDRHATCYLRVTRAGYASLELTNLHAGEYVEIVLHPAVALRLRAYDEAGRPIEGCALRLFRPWYGDDIAYEHRGVTDAAGEYLFEDLPPGGTAWLEPSAPHHGCRAWMRLSIPETGEAVETIELPTGRTLRGRVTDAATDQPIVGAHVGIGRDLRRAVTTDPDGRYVLEGWVSRSAHCLCVEADGYARAQARVLDREGLDFALLAERILQGRVVDAHGASIAGAHVGAVGHLLHPDLMLELSRATGTSDVEGRFRLHGLRRDLPHRLIILATGHGRGLLELGPLGESARPMDLGDVVLPPSRRVTGRVLDASGLPVPRLYVSLVGPDVPEEPWRPRVPNYGRSPGAHTDDLGRFAFTDLAPGTYRLGAGSADARVERDIILTPGGDVDGLEVRLLSPDRWPVRVVDEAGDPVAGVIAQPVDADGSLGTSMRTDECGEAVFEREGAPACVVLRLYGEQGKRYAPMPRTPWPEGASTLVVRLRPALVVAGAVTDEGNAALAFHEVRVEWDDGHERTWTDDAGAFHFSLASDEPVDVIVTGIIRTEHTEHGRGWRSVRRPVEARIRVTPPSPHLTLVAARLATSGSLSILVLDPEGQPVPGAQLGFLPGLPLPTSPLLTDAAGRASVEGIDRRPLTVAASGPPDGGPWAPARVDDVVPDGREVILRLAAFLEIRGRVLAPDGTPVEGATVGIAATTVRGGVSTNAEGVFSLLLPPSFAPATLVVDHTPTMDVRWTGRVDGVGPDHTDVTIQLHAE